MEPYERFMFLDQSNFWVIMISKNQTCHATHLKVEKIFTKKPGKNSAGRHACGKARRETLHYEVARTCFAEEMVGHLLLWNACSICFWPVWIRWYFAIDLNFLAPKPIRKRNKFHRLHQITKKKTMAFSTRWAPSLAINGVFITSIDGRINKWVSLGRRKKPTDLGAPYLHSTNWFRGPPFVMHLFGLKPILFIHSFFCQNGSIITRTLRCVCVIFCWNLWGESQN